MALIFEPKDIYYYIIVGHDSVDDLLDGTTSEESDSEDSDDELVIRQRQLAARKAAMEASRQNNVKKIVDLTNTNKSPLSKEAKAKFEVSFLNNNVMNIIYCRSYGFVQYVIR